MFYKNIFAENASGKQTRFNNGSKYSSLNEVFYVC